MANIPDIRRSELMSTEWLSLKFELRMRINAMLSYPASALPAIWIFIQDLEFGWVDNTWFMKVFQ